MCFSSFLLPGDQRENRHRETLRGGEKGRLAAYSGAQGRTWRCFPWVFFMVLISWTGGWGSRYPKASVDKEKEKPVLSSSGPGTRQPGKAANFQTMIIVCEKAPQIQPRHQPHLHHKGQVESLHLSLPPRQGGDTDGGWGAAALLGKKPPQEGQQRSHGILDSHPHPAVTRPCSPSPRGGLIRGWVGSWGIHTLPEAIGLHPPP